MAHKFTFSHERSAHSVSIETDEDSNLPGLLEAFECYLVACGYSLAGGHVEIIGEN